MIICDNNNFGAGQIQINDYQSEGLCVLNTKILIDPTSPAYQRAERLEVQLPVSFAIEKSAVTSALLMSSRPGQQWGTVVKCWIENRKLVFEKITAFDSWAPTTLMLHNAFVTLGYRGERTNFTKTTITGPTEYRLNSYSCVVADNWVFFGGYFRDFPSWNDEPKSHTLVFTGFPEDIDLNIVFVPNCFVTMPGQIGSPLQLGHISGNTLTFEYDTTATNIGGSDSSLCFFAVRNIPE